MEFNVASFSHHRSKKHKSKKRKLGECSSDGDSHKLRENSEEMDVRAHGGWWKTTAIHQVRYRDGGTR